MEAIGRVSVLLLVVSGASAAACATARPVAASPPALRPILDGKYLVDVPADAVAKQNPHDVMSPEPSHQIQDNLWVERKDFRFAVIAEETFIKCDRGFAAPSPASPGTKEVRVTTAHPEILALLATRDPVGRTGHTTHLGLATICVPGDTVTSLNFATDLQPSGDLRAVMTMRDRLLASLTLGARRASVRARTETLKVAPDQTFTLRLPDDYMLFREEGPDFIVYRIRNVDRDGTEKASGLIYFGDHPQGSAASDSSVAGTLLGEPITWQQPEQGELRHLKKVSGHYIDIFLISADPRKLSVLKALAESLQRR